ncbi:arsenate reductase (glutaredoxin) [Sphingomonas sp.]|uniref:arsenate reductase (glutaredoxin) n=1 Tax=Sphingomonas sp. TaxID=28214 RepID=UPI002DE9AE16|nr:arsenate reductase (glutaredoxin) [Sphingomonas sp.]HEV2567486.1 arsenate reductase (glutaredoxin) [Sphingomonas sp.]
MEVTIYHNPECGTSRKVLAALQEAGHEPQIIDYRKTGWTREQLEDLFACMGVSPRDALRTKGALAGELGLLEGASDDRILDAMVEHPALVERPIVETRKGVRLCRPAERVQELL